MNWRNIQIFGFSELRKKLLPLTIILLVVVVGMVLMTTSPTDPQVVPLTTGTAVQNLEGQETTNQEQPNSEGAILEETSEEAPEQTDTPIEEEQIDYTQYPGTCGGDIMRAESDVQQLTNQVNEAQTEYDTVQKDYETQLQILAQYQNRLDILQATVTDNKKHLEGAQEELETLVGSCSLSS